MDALNPKMTHPKIGSRMKRSKSQAKAPKIRHTLLRNKREFLLEVASTHAANAAVKVSTSIIRPSMIALFSWNRAALKPRYSNTTRVSRELKKNPTRASYAMK